MPSRIDANTESSIVLGRVWSYVQNRSGFGITLHEWVRKHEIDTGIRDGVTSDERERLKALGREVKELRKANEIQKSASAFFYSGAELDR